MLLRLLYDSTTVAAAYIYISLQLHHSSHLDLSCAPVLVAETCSIITICVHEQPCYCGDATSLLSCAS